MILKALKGKAATALKIGAHRLTVYEGAVGSGKTYGSLLDWLRFIRNAPKGDLVMVGRTERTIINNCVLPMQEWLGADRVRINYGRGTVTINFGSGNIRTINIIGANNEQARTKIQGWTIVGAYVDEVALVPESFFNMLWSRLRVPGARCWATCNPEGPRHWFKTKWLDQATTRIHGDGTVTVDEEGDNRIARFTFLIDDNRENLDPQFVEDLLNSYAEDSVFYRRFILSEWAAAEGRILTAFDPTKHVIPVDQEPEIIDWISIGVDDGVRDNARALLLAVIAHPTIPGEHALYLTDEWSAGRITDAEKSAGLAAWQQVNRASPRFAYADPTAASLRLQMQRDGHRVAQADNDVNPGNQTLDSLFAAGLLYVSERCKLLLDEIPGYVWAETTKDGREKPVKVDDHSIDAARYAVWSSRHLWRRWVKLTIMPKPTEAPEAAAA